MILSLKWVRLCIDRSLPALVIIHSAYASFNTAIRRSSRILIKVGCAHRPHRLPRGVFSLKTSLRQPMHSTSEVSVRNCRQIILCILICVLTWPGTGKTPFRGAEIRLWGRSYGNSIEVSRPIVCSFSPDGQTVIPHRFDCLENGAIQSFGMTLRVGGRFSFGGVSIHLLFLVTLIKAPYWWRSILHRSSWVMRKLRFCFRWRHQSTLR
jgi:hypothetical protein